MPIDATVHSYQSDVVDLKLDNKLRPPTCRFPTPVVYQPRCTVVSIKPFSHTGPVEPEVHAKRILCLLLDGHV